MVEIIGSEFQIMRTMGYVSMVHGKAFYRKTTDSNGDDYFLILNANGEEVAEWDDSQNEWSLILLPRPAGNTLGTTEITGMDSRIEKQQLLMCLRKGSLPQLLPGAGVRKKRKQL